LRILYIFDIYKMSDDEREDRVANALRSYNSTKGMGVAQIKIDKRAETSKTNMAKARAAKLAGLRAKKVRIQIGESEEEVSQDSEDSEEEWELTSKKRGKGRAGGAAPAVDSIDRSEMMKMMAQLLKAEKKKKPITRKVVDVAPAIPDAKKEELRKNVASWF
jgi:hypothetical protein